jgi:hypothetical protein
MKAFLKTAILTGTVFGVAMGMLFARIFGTPWALLSALPNGALFGLAMATFMHWQGSAFQKQTPCQEGEVLVKQGPANHFRGLEGVGGWLYLTNRRLVFRSHAFNVQNHELSLPLAAVQAVETCPTAWVIPNGLRLLTADGIERFVVYGRRAWLEQINQSRRGAGA